MTIWIRPLKCSQLQLKITRLCTATPKTVEGEGNRNGFLNIRCIVHGGGNGNIDHTPGKIVPRGGSTNVATSSVGVHLAATGFKTPVLRSPVITGEARGE